MINGMKSYVHVPRPVKRLKINKNYHDHSLYIIVYDYELYLYKVNYTWYCLHIIIKHVTIQKINKYAFPYNIVIKYDWILTRSHIL